MIGFDYQVPVAVDDALNLLTEHGYDAKLLAGGQSLLVLMRQRLVAPKVLIGLSGLAELRGIESNGAVVIGSMITYNTLAESEIIKSKIPLLARAAGSVGSIHIRHRGTIGGALAHCDPSGDVPTALMTLGASYKARSTRGSVLYDSNDFSVGIFETRLAEDELLVTVEVPAQPERVSSGYRRFSYREGEYPMAVAACRLEWDADSGCQAATVAIGGGDAFPKRLSSLEAGLAGFDFEQGSLKDLLHDAAVPELNTSADIRGGAAWKNKVVISTLQKALDEACSSREGQAHA